MTSRKTNDALLSTAAQGAAEYDQVVTELLPQRDDKTQTRMALCDVDSLSFISK